MPVNTWNFYRAVSVGSDHKSWLSQNPQVRSSQMTSMKNILLSLGRRWKDWWKSGIWSRGPRPVSIWGDITFAFLIGSWNFAAIFLRLLTWWEGWDSIFTELRMHSSSWRKDNGLRKTKSLPSNKKRGRRKHWTRDWLRTDKEDWEKNKYCLL